MHHSEDYGNPCNVCWCLFKIAELLFFSWIVTYTSWHKKGSVTPKLLFKRLLKSHSALSGIKQAHILLWSWVYLYVRRGQTNLMTHIYYQQPLGNNTYCDIVSVCSQKYLPNAIRDLFFLPSLLSFLQYIFVTFVTCSLNKSGYRLSILTLISCDPVKVSISFAR